MSISLRGAVLGYPVEHSLSPLLHREAMKYLGVAGDYQRREVHADTLSRFFSENRNHYDYLSITMPLKEEALQLPVLNDPLVERIKSANTLYRQDGSWHLTSTDGIGFLSALHAKGYTKFNRTLILGAGGTARAVVGALDGVSDEIVVLGRTSTRKEVLERSVERSFFTYQRWSDSPGVVDYDLVVNTTPAGAADLLADSIFPGDCKLFFDVIYSPWPTVMGARWEDSGGLVINGLELLIYQGIEQLSFVLKTALDREALANHLRPILKRAIQ